MQDAGAKQQIIEKIKGNTNILVTVSTDPSVDELSAALGLTLLLNKMNKHATAVFSGAIPPAITFLDPEKTFENTVDSLRDFIIALDKEKADHLRYKVDGDVVKIFITPYRTTISSDDLDFSQGDYNVELVLALGVRDRDDLDGALSAHGRILHDATVVTMSVGEAKSELGSIDWQDENASSLSEMLVSLSETLKSDKALLDEQTATAFLTGIVAATDRFSNNRTSSRVMTMAAQLMSAGANQQLIASKLEEAHEIGPGAGSSGTEGENSDGTTNLSEGESTKVNKKQASKEKKQGEARKRDDGSLTISHEKQGDVDEVRVATEAEEREKAAKVAEQNLAHQLSSVAPAATSGVTPSVADLQKDLAAASAEIDEAAEQAPEAANSPLSGAVSTDEWQTKEQAPAMGGTLNATTEQAAEDKRHALESDRNHTILSHNNNSNNYVGDTMPTFQSPLNAASQPDEDPPMIDPFKDMAPPSAPDTAPTAYAQTVQPPVPAETLADLDKQNRAPHEEARAAVDAAFGAVPFSPAGHPVASIGAQPLGEVSHEQSPAQPPANTLPMPPLPDFSTLPPLPVAPGTSNMPVGGLPPEKLEDLFTPTAHTPTLSPTPPQPNDPGQFKIPGQT